MGSLRPDPQKILRSASLKSLPPEFEHVCRNVVLQRGVSTVTQIGTNCAEILSVRILMVRDADDDDHDADDADDDD